MGCCGSGGAVATCPEGELWTYTPANNKAIIARGAPNFKARRTGRRLEPGETFRVTHTKKARVPEVGNVIFLRLAEDGGWLFDTMPNVGVIATKGDQARASGSGSAASGGAHTYSPREPEPMPVLAEPIPEPVPVPEPREPEPILVPGFDPLASPGMHSELLDEDAPRSQHWDAMCEEALVNVVDKNTIDHTGANEEQKCWSCACVE